MSKYQLGLEKVKNKNSIQYISHKKLGFTLAEVLITLVVIGIVAVIVIPAMQSKYNKTLAESKLSKFYSTINQAVRLSEIENGSHVNWDSLGASCDYDEENDSCISGSEDALQWFNKYLAKYINYNKIETYRYQPGENPQPDAPHGSVKCLVYFSDGSLLVFNKRAVTFFLSANDFRKYFNDEKKIMGTKSFVFYYYQDVNHNAFESFNFDKEHNYLLSDQEYGCNHTASNKYVNCSALIQQNGWKVPDDYPIKF